MMAVLYRSHTPDVSITVSPRLDLRAILQSFSVSALQPSESRIGFLVLALAIIGAVHIAQPLSRIASLADYAVRIIDPRTAFATEERFPGAALSHEWPDEALAAGARVSAPRAFEGDILAAMHGAIYRGGGDDPANEFIIGSGRGSLLCRYYSGRRTLAAQEAEDMKEGHRIRPAAHCDEEGGSAGDERVVAHGRPGHG